MIYFWKSLKQPFFSDFIWRPAFVHCTLPAGAACALLVRTAAALSQGVGHLCTDMQPYRLLFLSLNPSNRERGGKENKKRSQASTWGNMHSLVPSWRPNRVWIFYKYQNYIVPSVLWDRVWCLALVKLSDSSKLMSELLSPTGLNVWLHWLVENVISVIHSLCSNYISDLLKQLKSCTWQTFC